jgi:hypothetical protein
VVRDTTISDSERKGGVGLPAWNYSFRTWRWRFTVLSKHISTRASTRASTSNSTNRKQQQRYSTETKKLRKGNTLEQKQTHNQKQKKKQKQHVVGENKKH